jgi:hypothetical protein
MRMDLIQPFINSADAVLAQGLQSPISVETLSMEEEAYRRKGIAAEVALAGEIEGRIIFDVDMKAAVQLALQCPRPMKSWCGRQSVSWRTRLSAMPSPRSTTRDFIFMSSRPSCIRPSKGARAVKIQKLW